VKEYQTVLATTLQGWGSLASSVACAADCVLL